MKVSLVLATSLVLLVQRISCAAIGESLSSAQQPQEMISLEDVEADLSKLDRADLEYLAEVARTKRSGDLLSAIKHKIASGIQAKLGAIGHGSASASGHFSGGSSGYGGHGHGHGYEYDHHDYSSGSYEHNHVDFWTLKKSILSTLLQAAKAIKGGVIAIKGQLIKGGGHLLSAKGKLISSKGEAITQLGRHIASTAKLYPSYSHSVHHHAPVASGHVYGHSGPESYGHSSEYSSSAGVEDYPAIGAGHSGEYSVPAAAHYNAYNNYNSALEAHRGHKLPNAAHAGIVIMKKIPNGNGHLHQGSGTAPSSSGYSFGGVHDSQPPAVYAPAYPDFKPLGPPPHSYPYHSRKPSYASLFKGVFSASASPSKFKHSAPPSHIYSSPPGAGHPDHFGHSQLPMEIDYDPSHPNGPNFDLVSPHGGHDHGHHSITSTSDSVNSYNAPQHVPQNTPPSTNYGYPVEPLRYNGPQGLAEQHPQQAPPAQILITPTTNFIEYTNIQNADSHQHLQQPQPLPQPHLPHAQQLVQAAPISTSQQMAEEVIKYLGNLQQQQHQGAATPTNHKAANNVNSNPQLFFGLNVPLTGDEGHGGETQDESFPLYPPGTNPQDPNHAKPFFMPTPLPPDNSGAYPPSGTEYSGEQPAHLYPSHHNAGGYQQTDSYGNPVQVASASYKSIHYQKNPNFGFVTTNSHPSHSKPSGSHPNHHNHHHHHPNGVVSPRHKSKPEFDIIRSVSYELGAAGGSAMQH